MARSGARRSWETENAKASRASLACSRSPARCWSVTFRSNASRRSPSRRASNRSRASRRSLSWAASAWSWAVRAPRRWMSAWTSIRSWASWASRRWVSAWTSIRSWASWASRRWMSAWTSIRSWASRASRRWVSVLVLDLAGVAPLAVDGSLSLILVVLEGFTDHAVAALAGRRLICGGLLVLWSPGHLSHPCVTRRTGQPAAADGGTGLPSKARGQQSHLEEDQPAIGAPNRVRYSTNS